jgi:preprotein translocase subunit SecE
MAKTITVADQQITPLERMKSRVLEFPEFLKDVRAEMRKVVAPTWPEVQSTTAIVLVTVFIFAAYFAVTDYIFGQGITRLIQFLTKH